MKNKIKNLTLTGIALTSLLLTGAPHTFAQTGSEVEFRGRGGSARLHARSSEAETRGRVAEGEAPKGQDNLEMRGSARLNHRISSDDSSESEDIRREDRRIGRRENRREDRRLGMGGSARLSRRANSNDNSGPGSISSNKGRGGSARLSDRMNSDNSGQTSRGGAILRRRIRFSGIALNGEIPKGHADFRVLSRNRGNRLNVSVQNVELNDGTLLDVNACGTKVGTMFLRLGRGQLSIQEKNGNAVPTCGTGKIVSVANGTNTILSGTF